MTQDERQQTPPKREPVFTKVVNQQQCPPKVKEPIEFFKNINRVPLNLMKQEKFKLDTTTEGFIRYRNSSLIAGQIEDLASTVFRPMDSEYFSPGRSSQLDLTSPAEKMIPRLVTVSGLQQSLPPILFTSSHPRKQKDLPLVVLPQHRILEDKPYKPIIESFIPRVATAAEVSKVEHPYKDKNIPLQFPLKNNKRMIVLGNNTNYIPRSVTALDIKKRPHPARNFNIHDLNSVINDR